MGPPPEGGPSNNMLGSQADVTYPPLRRSYAMSGTHVRYGTRVRGMVLRGCYREFGTARAEAFSSTRRCVCAAIGLRAHYAMPGTDVARICVDRAIWYQVLLLTRAQGATDTRGHPNHVPGSGPPGMPPAAMMTEGQLRST
eukprot:1978339-Rhodomonas_salina.1